MFHETLHLTKTELSNLQRAFAHAKEIGCDRFMFKGIEFRVAHAHNTLSNVHSTTPDCVSVDLTDEAIRLDSEDKTIPVFTGRVSI